MMLRLIFAAIFTVTTSAAAQTPPAPRPEAQSCAPGGGICISRRTYARDTCSAIAAAAALHELDEGFLARLLWRESRFDPAAVSPMGAQGIAQFMPATAARRGLDDPFNPAAAIFASAEYLAELTRRFGNEGLAAVAYNAGERRAARLSEDPAYRLPSETRAYVPLVTGQPARAWAETPRPKSDFRLDGDTPFAGACETLAAGRIPEFRPQPPPWGVIVAAARLRGTAERFADRVRAENAAIIGDRTITFVEAAMPGFGDAPRHTAQIATGERGAAIALCSALRANGAFCQVNRR